MKTNRGFQIALIFILSLIVLGILARTRRSFLYSGTIEATRIEVPARVASVIQSKEAQEGQKVVAGQVLYRLSGEEIRLAAQMAERDFARAAKLFKQGSMSEETYEHLRVKRDDSALKLKWCSIEAPASGIVTTLYREPGEWVNPGTKMAQLLDLNEVWAIFYIEQPRLASFRLGQRIVANLPELKGRNFEGTVTKIADEAEFTPKNIQTRQERERLVYAIKVNFKNPDGVLKPGMTFEAKL